MKRERVVAYIDGFNLYSGIKEGGLRHFLWLNVHELAQQLLKSNQELVCVRYFTALITYNYSKREVQKHYLSALETIPNVIIKKGDFIAGPRKCKALCGEVYTEYSEKMTDVNIATHMIHDAYTDLFDAAMVISGDTDLIPPVDLIHEVFPEKKRAFVAFPPGRKNDQVAAHAKGSFIIGRKVLKDSQLPDIVTDKMGNEYRRPEKWNPTPP